METSRLALDVNSANMAQKLMRSNKREREDGLSGTKKGGGFGASVESSEGTLGLSSLISALSLGDEDMDIDEVLYVY
jgi:phage-related protein